MIPTLGQMIDLRVYFPDTCNASILRGYEVLRERMLCLYSLLFSRVLVATG